MKNKAVSGIMLTLLLTSMSTLAFNIQPVKSDWTSTQTVYIRADGSVDPPTAPISSVDNITYTLTDNIVGDVPMWASAIVVERDNVVVNGAGLMLQGTGASFTKGIFLSGRRNVTIRNMEIKKFDSGITLSCSSNNNVSGNNITANTDDGITLFESLNNTISGNNITNNGIIGILGAGIYVSLDSHHNNIQGNRIKKNNYGIWLLLSDNNNVSCNTIANNNRGIALGGASNNTLSDNLIEDNNEGIFCGGSMNNKLSENRIANNNCGIYLRDDSNCNSIFGNYIANSNQGIWLRYSSNNSVSGNYIVHNQKCGIWVYKDSNHNSISENNLVNNLIAIWFCTFSKNEFYHNNFINNRNQIFAEPYNVNSWDIGYPSGGNYWSDHVTVDDYSGTNQDEPGSDGIVDEPYIIDEYNRDNYPLVEPWSLVISATVDIDPDTLNLRGGGKWITAYIQLPEGYNAEEIDATTILLNETISPVLDLMYEFVTNSSEYLVDHDEDGILERMVKFDKAEVTALLSVGEATLTITGEVNGTPFEGSDSVRVR